MREGPRNKWPGPDEKQTVTQMLADPYCDHWNECGNFFARLVQLSGLPDDMHNDVVQNALLSVYKNLSGFRFECKFSTWLVRVGNSRISDARRERKRTGGQVSIQSGTPDNEENETGVFSVKVLHTTEELCVIHENVSEVMRILSEYLSTHAHTERNRQIFQKVLFESRTIRDVSKELGVPAANIRYTIHAFQRYLYDRFNKQDPPNETTS